MRTWHAWLTLLLVADSIRGDEARKPVRRYRIEVLYTMHTSVDTNEKLALVRKLVRSAYPEARFTEASAEERRVYYEAYGGRLLRMAGVAPPATEDAARLKWIDTEGYDVVKAQVDREVALRSFYDFLLTQAKDDVSLRTVFDRLKGKDAADTPICGTEPGRTLVYRDFGGKPLTGDELANIQDGGVKFSSNFRMRVVWLGEDAPRIIPRAHGLGDNGEGRFILRLIEVTATAPR